LVIFLFCFVFRIVTNYFLGTELQALTMTDDKASATDDNRHVPTSPRHIGTATATAATTTATATATAAPTIAAVGAAGDKRGLKTIASGTLKICMFFSFFLCFLLLY
jgi:hypothetical protein